MIVVNMSDKKTGLSIDFPDQGMGLREKQSSKPRFLSRNIKCSCIQQV